MARTTKSQVIEVLGKDYDTSPNGNRSVQPYIDSASIIVDKIADQPWYKGSLAELEIIERWLAACYYCFSDKPFSSQSTQGSSASYMGQSGQGLDSNPYGQAAKRLDSSGYLFKLDTHSVAGLLWMGKTVNEELTYEQRN